MIEEKNKMVRFSPPKEKERLLSYIIKYRKQFLITAVSGIFFNSAIVLGPIFQGKLLDAAVNSPSITNKCGNFIYTCYLVFSNSKIF